MGKPTHDGWKPGDELPEPDPDHWTTDPLWKLKVRRVTNVVRSNTGKLLALGLIIVVALLTWLT